MKNKKLKADIILAIVILAIAGISFIFMMSNKQDGAYAVVKINGVEVGRYPLDKDKEYSLNNGTNILVIKDGKAHISYANCPDQICVKEGEISQSHQCITCLPNKLTITIEGKNSDVDLSN